MAVASLGEKVVEVTTPPEVVSVHLFVRTNNSGQNIQRMPNAGHEILRGEKAWSDGAGKEENR